MKKRKGMIEIQKKKIRGKHKTIKDEKLENILWLWRHTLTEREAPFNRTRDRT